MVFQKGECTNKSDMNSIIPAHTAAPGNPENRQNPAS